MKFRKNKKTIAMVLYPGVTALEVVGTLETLIGLNLNSPFRTVTVGASVDPIQTDTSLRLVPNQAFWEVPSPYGLIVPGDSGASASAGVSDALQSYIQTASKSAAFVASIGTGSLILAGAGLLESRQATTHWQFAQQLKELGVQYVRQRWVEDGKFITAAGTTAGIDMSLHLLAKLTSISAARRMQLVIEYDPQPPSGGINWDQVDLAEPGTGHISDEASDRKVARENVA